MDRSLIRINNAIYAGTVFSDHFMLSDHLCHGKMRLVILHGNHQSGCVHIDTVNNTRSDNTVDVRKLTGTVEKQRIYERPGIMTRSRMDDHPLRLIDDDQIIIFIYNIQRDIFRFCISIDRRRKINIDLLSSLHLK